MSCRKSFDWIINLILWAGIAILVIGYLDVLSIDLKNVGLIITIVSAIVYLLNAFISPHCSYFMNQTDTSKIYETIDQTFKQPPRITMHVQCYHYVTHFAHRRRSKGRSSVHRQRRRVVTHTARKDFKYISWRDVSGQFQLDTSEAMKDEDIAYVMLDLDYQINFANDGSSEDFANERREFKENNRRDRYQRYTEHFVVDGFKSTFMIQVTDSVPLCFGIGWFIFFTFLTFHALYRSYVDSHCHTQNFTVKKVVSSRKDLYSEELKRQFEYYDPRLVLRQQTVMFHPNQPPQVIPIMPMGQPMPGMGPQPNMFLPAPPPPQNAILFVPVTQFAEPPQPENDDEDDSNNQTVQPMPFTEPVQQVNVTSNSSQLIYPAPQNSTPGYQGQPSMYQQSAPSSLLAKTIIDSGVNQNPPPNTGFYAAAVSENQQDHSPPKNAA